MRAFVTGGTGFIGGAVVRRLLQCGHEVNALVRPGADTRQLDGLPVSLVTGDLRDRACLRRGMEGCEWIFHVGALYSYWGYTWEEFQDTNVDGVRRVIQAAAAAGARRIVHTSSIAALGMNPDHSPATEETPSTLEQKIGSYQRSKFLGQQVALDAALSGLPVVVVNPSSPVGVGDLKPTPTGQIIVDYLNGRMFGYVDTGLNIVDVEDVAAGHLLAAERGRVGECYILGGENLTLKRILDLLSEISGRPPVRWRVPRWLAMTWSYVDVAVCNVSGRTPTATPEKVRLSARYEYFDPSKAVRELAMPQTPVREALRKAVEWYQANGYAS